MEHPCYKCQASIDETLPFCPHCGAPQIRVAAPDEDAGQSAPLTPDAPHVISATSWTSAPAYHPNAIQWNAAWKAALLGGLIATVLCGIPFVSYGFCLWLLGTGALAVFLYQRRVPGAFVTTGMGMRIGALTGVVGYFVSTLWLIFGFAWNTQEFRAAMQEVMEKMVASNPDPRAQDAARQLMATLNTPQGLATFLVLCLIIMAVSFVVFSAAGGALGASLFSPRRNVR